METGECGKCVLIYNGKKDNTYRVKHFEDEVYIYTNKKLYENIKGECGECIELMKE